MSEEEQSKRRRRGRRGGGSGRPREGAEIPQSQPEPEVPAAEDVGDEPVSSASTSQETTRARRERKPVKSSASADVNPMDFWRSGRARSHRPESVAAGAQKRSIMYRLRHLYFPPWVPVAFISFVVMAILGGLFLTRSATGAPRQGDHWHATYTFYACGEKQPNAPTWEYDIHTHNDGIFHIHPFQPSSEGAGARMVKWFDYGGGELTGSKIRLPGLSKTWENGETCPDDSPDAGKEGRVQVFVNGAKFDDWSRYIPNDGDRVQLIFGPEQEIVQLDDRQVIDEAQSTRTIEITITGDEAETQINPRAPTVKAGEAVKLLVHNQGALTHGLRIAGPDGEYDTADDFVVVPVDSDPTSSGTSTILQPGADGFTVVRFDTAGQIKFQDPTTTDPATGDSYVTGTIIVESEVPGSPTPVPEDQVDQSVDVEMQGAAFVPADLTLEADKKFGINLTNTSAFIHNLRIDGPDGEFETDDDILSPDIDPNGGTGKAIGTLEAGTYSFRDDFNPTQMTGTLEVE